MAIITVVGGANLDMQGFSSNRLRPHDSNPGLIRTSAGGVGRNIAENLARLGHTVRLITVLGDDEQGRLLLQNLEEVGLGATDVELLAGRSTSVYLCLLDSDASLHAAVADMTILEALDSQLLRRHARAFEDIDLCVVDANLAESAIECVLELSGAAPCLLDPVSATKASRARRLAGRFYAAKPNEAELSVLVGLDTAEDLDGAVDRLHAAGTDLVFVSLGADGLHYSDGRRRGDAAIANTKPVNVNGAGDAMSAAIAGAIADGKSIEEAAAFAVAAAAITTESESTVSPLIDGVSVAAKARQVVLHSRN